MDEDDMLEALSTGKVFRYVTDFPTPKMAGHPGVIAIPHLGASTCESEDNCAIMAVTQLMAFLENGTISNSVNFPIVTTAIRIMPGVLLFITGISLT